MYLYLNVPPTFGKTDKVKQLEMLYVLEMRRKMRARWWRFEYPVLNANLIFASSFSMHHSVSLDKFLLFFLILIFIMYIFFSLNPSISLSITLTLCICASYSIARLLRLHMRQRSLRYLCICAEPFALNLAYDCYNIIDISGAGITCDVAVASTTDILVLLSLLLLLVLLVALLLLLLLLLDVPLTQSMYTYIIYIFICYTMLYHTVRCVSCYIVY